MKDEVSAIPSPSQTIFSSDSVFTPTPPPACEAGFKIPTCHHSKVRTREGVCFPGTCLH